MEADEAQVPARKQRAEREQVRHQEAGGEREVRGVAERVERRVYPVRALNRNASYLPQPGSRPGGGSSSGGGDSSSGGRGSRAAESICRLLQDCARRPARVQRGLEPRAQQSSFLPSLVPNHPRAQPTRGAWCTQMHESLACVHGRSHRRNERAEDTEVARSSLDYASKTVHRGG